MKPRFLICILPICILGGLPFHISSAAEPQKNDLPNIVVILADDLGYGDVAALNADSKIPTPQLDRLAADGMTFTDAHSPSAVCTPTRYGMLTGRYCWRTKLKRGVLNGYSPPLIQAGQPTIASVAKRKGYHTGIVGKWHLGLGWTRTSDQASPEPEIDFTRELTSTPNNYGFDFSYVIPASLDFPPYVFIRNKHVTAETIINQPRQTFPAYLRNGPRGTDLVMEDCLDHLTDEATQFIQRRAKADNPFLLYFPLTAPHKPVLPHARFRGLSKLGPYGDFVMQVDATVGRVLQAIDDAGIRDNTLVIFTSDNGSFMRRKQGVDHVADESLQQYDPKHHQANFIYRGTKADIWEAGHRVPFFVRWPKKIKKSENYDQTICAVDLLATVADAIGEDKPAQAVDSYSFLSCLTDNTVNLNRPPVIHHSGSGMFSLRQGKWKLVLGDGSGGREKPKGKPFQRPYALFDLESDPSESVDLAKNEPAIMNKLEQFLIQIRAEQ